MAEDPYIIQNHDFLQTKSAQQSKFKSYIVLLKLWKLLILILNIYNLLFKSTLIKIKKIHKSYEMSKYFVHHSTHFHNVVIQNILFVCVALSVHQMQPTNMLRGQGGKSKLIFQSNAKYSNCFRLWFRWVVSVPMFFLAVRLWRVVSTTKTIHRKEFPGRNRGEDKSAPIQECRDIKRRRSSSVPCYASENTVIETVIGAVRIVSLPMFTDDWLNVDLGAVSSWVLKIIRKNVNKLINLQVEVNFPKTVVEEEDGKGGRADLIEYP